MNYLFSYLRTLRPEEQSRVAALDLSVRQQEVLCAVAKAAKENLTDKNELLRTLSISSTNFDKTCSLLLKRLLEECSGQGLARLSDIRSRYLFPLLLHEIKKQEKTLLKGAPKEVLREFYWQAFKLMDSTTEFGYNAGETMRLFDCYTALRPGKGVTHFREAVELYHQIFNKMKLGNFEEALSDVESRLPCIQHGIENGEDLPRFYAHRAMSQYYSLLKVDIGERINHLLECLSIIVRCPEYFEKRDAVLIEATIAESEYFRDNLQEALGRYKRIYREHPTVLERDYYHILKVAQIGMIVGEYSYVEDIIHQWFGQPPYKTPSPPLCLALICLADNRIEEAGEYIRNGMACNQNNVIYEAHFRVLETFYFTFRGDHDFAASLIEKHVKYLRAHGMGVKQSNFPRILHLIRDIVTEKMTGTPLTKRYQEYYNHLQFGARRQYGVLLEKLKKLEV